jgi:hypothetical protein
MFHVKHGRGMTISSETPPKKADINKILRGASPEIRALLRLAHAQGYVVRHTRSNHYSITTPMGARKMRTVFAPGTPSDIRSVHRVRIK